MRDLAEFEVWASQQTELSVSAPPFDREIEVHPAVYQVGLGIILGGLWVERAVEEGYEEEIEIETWYPRRLFDAEAIDEIVDEAEVEDGNSDASA